MRERSGIEAMLRKAAMGAVLLVVVPLTLIQALGDATGHWLKVVIVLFIWTLGVGVGSVLSEDIRSRDESETRGAGARNVRAGE
jgi:hypothetical protein